MYLFCIHYEISKIESNVILSQNAFSYLLKVEAIRSVEYLLLKCSNDDVVGMQSKLLYTHDEVRITSSFKFLTCITKKEQSKHLWIFQAWLTSETKKRAISVKFIYSQFRKFQKQIKLHEFVHEKKREKRNMHAILRQSLFSVHVKNWILFQEENVLWYVAVVMTFLL